MRQCVFNARNEEIQRQRGKKKRHSLWRAAPSISCSVGDRCPDQPDHARPLLPLLRARRKFRGCAMAPTKRENRLTRPPLSALLLSVQQVALFSFLTPVFPPRLAAISSARETRRHTLSPKKAYLLDWHEATPSRALSWTRERGSRQAKKPQRGPPPPEDKEKHSQVCGKAWMSERGRCFVFPLRCSAMASTRPA